MRSILYHNICIVILQKTEVYVYILITNQSTHKWIDVSCFFSIDFHHIMMVIYLATDSAEDIHVSGLNASNPSIITRIHG